MNMKKDKEAKIFFKLKMQFTEILKNKQKIFFWSLFLQYL